MQLRPDLKRGLRNFAIAAGCVAVALCACLAWAWSSHATANTAIVIVREATVRAGPLEESQNAFTANDGAELRVLDRKDD